MDSDYIHFCLNEYQKVYSQILATFPQADHEDARRAAQKQAIRDSSITAIKTFPAVEPSAIWKTIYLTHVFNVSGMNDASQIASVISADNSWKKSSGHAFEEMVKQLGNQALSDCDIVIHLQKDVSLLLKSNRIANDCRDVQWLRKQIEASIFDLYLARKLGDLFMIFGCIQTKTSIRDRVTRDREPSINAMRAYFFSIAIVLDGEFLRLPKFMHMVNGNSSEYELNGWHAMYVLSNQSYSADRIHNMDFNMKLFRDHVSEAARFWETSRQWFDNTWRPKPAKVEDSPSTR